MAFLTPAGQKVCILVNTTDQKRSFNLSFNGKVAPISLSSGAVATLVW
ncbi:glycoside hydrolase family 30 beta sandwich domain-containing protein [Arachidicoccus ginsenosidivorans]|nr:glycoside hydrolase family 30 beta sandwich domain-containing protein [Arachidicoccus ginsenosidivorans]